MSSSFEKLDFIIEKIEDIESFKARYKSIEDLLNDVRNFIAHDYEGVNKMIIEDIIRTQLPKLKQIILDIKN